MDTGSSRMAVREAGQVRVFDASGEEHKIPSKVVKIPGFEFAEVVATHPLMSVGYNEKLWIIAEPISGFQVSRREHPSIERAIADARVRMTTQGLTAKKWAELVTHALRIPPSK